MLIRHRILLSITLLAALFFSWNVSGQDLSLDEPDTIAVARTIGTYGYPSAWDGKAFIDVEHNYSKIGDAFVWTWHPWLQHYVTFLTLQVVPTSVDFGLVRLPFALIGAFTVGCTYLICRKVYKSNLTALLTSLGLMLCLPFFLYTRQVRYYAVAALFSSITAYFYIMIVQNKKLSRNDQFALYATTVCLFFSNYLVWASSVLLIMGAMWLKKLYRPLFVLSAISSGGVIWFLFFKPFSGNATLFAGGPIETYHRFIIYLHYLDDFVAPALVLIPLGALALYRKNVQLIALMLWIAIKLLFYATFQSAQGRYIVDCIPIVFIILGYSYELIVQKKQKLLACILFGVLIYTSFSTRSFAYELTGSYPSAPHYLGNYLKKHARPSDTFWSNNYTYQLYLYSDVQPLYLNCFDEAIPPAASNLRSLQWIIIFKPQKFDPRTHCQGEVIEKLRTTEFEKVPFSFPDEIFHINQPDIVLRTFPPVRAEKGDVEIYRRKRAQ